MRMTAIAIALLMSAPAIAQTTEMDMDADMSAQTDMTPEMDATHTDMTTHAHPVVAADMTPATSPVVQPSNANPEHDARGIAVISAPAVVPPGWNGLVVAAVGGPVADPVTGEPITGDDASYPACTARVTDNCLQTYERGRS